MKLKNIFTWNKHLLGLNFQAVSGRLKSVLILAVFVCFAAGIVANEYAHPGIVFAGVFAFFAILFLCLSKRTHGWIFIAIMVVFFALGMFYAECRRLLPHDHIYRLFRRVRGHEVVLTGRVKGDVKRQSGFGRPRTFVFAVEEIADALGQSFHTRGDIQVRMFHDIHIEPGMRLRVKGRLYSPFDFHSGRFSYRDFLRKKKIYLALSVKKDGMAEVVKGRQTHGNIFIRLRQGGKAVLGRYLSGMDLAVARALVFGDRAEVPPGIYELFQRTGTAHVLAISGLHMSILIVLMFVVLNIVGPHRLFRYIAVMVLMCLYIPLTGGRASVLRAGIMAAVYLGAFILERTRVPLNILGLAGLCILLGSPNEIFSAGFQLSFLAVFALIVLAPELDDWVKFIFPKRFEAIRTSVVFSSSAWLGVLGCVAYYFEMVTPIGLIANMVIIPLVTVLLGLSVTLVAVGSWFPMFSRFVAYDIQIVLRIMIHGLRWLAMVPGGWVRVEMLPVWACFAYYAALTAMIGWIKHIKRKRPPETRRSFS